MILGQPWLLLALLLLPVLWWLVRATPPAPRSQIFPALRLLADLQTAAQSPERTPPWLLALRLLVAICLILGLANPILHPGQDLPGRGPLLIVLDNGWATAADWPDRTSAADAAITSAARANRAVALLPTAQAADGAPPALIGPLPAAAIGARLRALAPLPWPSDHVAAAHVLDRAWRVSGGAVLYLSDGLADGSAATGWAAALGRAGAVTEMRSSVPAPLLLPPVLRDGRLILRLAAAPDAAPRHFAVLAQGADGRSLDEVGITIAAGAALGEAPLRLPLGIANTVARLRLAGAATAGGTVLLDARWQRRTVGLAAATAADAADAPLAGPLYFLNRALGTDVEVRRASLETLLAQPLSALILSDRPLTPGPELAAVQAFVEHGGLLIRFAGPHTAATPDPLLPVRLLRQDRSLGGALSWSRPAHLAAFPAAGPFADLVAPSDVTVSRQVLADPASLQSGSVWASLVDGTPLVSTAASGRGRIVLFHVSADADWSNLPLSGLFPAMLDRLVQLSTSAGGEGDNQRLAPSEVMNGYGELGPPNPAAGPVTAAALATARPSPQIPPGLYGPPNGRLAFNLGGALPKPMASTPVPVAEERPLGVARPERSLGAPLVAIALLLLIADLLASLALRGALARRRQGAAALLLSLGLAFAVGPAAHAEDAGGAPPVPAAALKTELAYVLSGDPVQDKLSHDGLASLSDFVTSRSAASLGPPAGIAPGSDDLSLYPLLYWPITPGSSAPSAAGIAALNRFMQDGGIILIDTRGGDASATGSGAGLQPGAEEALRRVTAGLEIPPLTPLNRHHVLAHSFYLLRDFPGRYAGGPVWVASGEDASNDGVSPLVIGGNDWAAAWDMADDGTFPFATAPGGEQQRLMAYRFGLNLVMYALTGTYKADQVHVPTILERLGE
jgi:hypothetical protein